MPLTAIADHVTGPQMLKAANSMGDASVLEPTAWKGTPQVLGLEGAWLEHDDVAKVENSRLLYADDYARLVSSGMTGMDSMGAMLPLGEQPQPYAWNGWTLVIVDGAYMYRNKLNRFVTPSELQAMMSGKMTNRFGQKIPAAPDGPNGSPLFHGPMTEWGHRDWAAGAAIFAGVTYLAYHAIKDVHRGVKAGKRKLHSIKQGFFA